MVNSSPDGVQKRGTKALLAVVIIMGVMIVVGTGVLISAVIRHAVNREGQITVVRQSAGFEQPERPLILTQPAGSHVASVVRQSDTLLAVTLSGGGVADRVVVWDIAAGRVVARLTLMQ